MIVVVLSDTRVLTGWPSRAVAERWLNGWLAESRARWGWVVQSEMACPKYGVSLAVLPEKGKKRKAKAE